MVGPSHRRRFVRPPRRRPVSGVRAPNDGASREGFSAEAKRSPSVALSDDYLASELRAVAALTEGDAHEAPPLLEGMELDACNPVEYNIPLNMGPLGRFLRGEFLARSGQEEEALGWFEGFAPLWGTEERLYQPYLYLRRGQLEDRLGQQTQAPENYLKFIEAWGRADPPLQHHVSFARERVADL
jgi:hypothetical protein